jgi:NADPH2:quinone reductase
MRAAYYRRLGAARDVLELGEIATPLPGPGEVRVRLATSGVNPSDVKTRSGTTPRAGLPDLVIPHSDGAGLIDAVGAGVPASRVGERVWVFNGQWKRAYGTAAEWIALPAEQAVPLPDSVDYAAGACLGIPAMTAHRAVTIGPPVAGAVVLVSGGAGAVGACAVQLAKARGATVIATVSSAEKAALVRELGADHAVNYREADVIAQVKALTGGAGVDRVIEVDFAANHAIVQGVLRPHGVAVVYGSGPDAPPMPIMAYARNNQTIYGILVYELLPADRDRAVAELTAALRQGALVNRVAARFPLTRIAEAHEAVEAGRMVGNVVIDIA